MRKEFRDWQINLTDSLCRIEDKLNISKSRVREHLIKASEAALARDLAEAAAIKGDWEKRQKRTDASNAAHQERLARVEELVEEFAADQTGENASTTLAEMLRILEEENIDSALDYLASQSTRLVGKAAAKTESARADLQPLLTGAQLAIANGQQEKAEILFQQLLAPGLPDSPEARHEYVKYLLFSKGPRQYNFSPLPEARAIYCEAERQSQLLILQEPGNLSWKRDLSDCHQMMGGTYIAKLDFTTARDFYNSAFEIRKSLVTEDPDNPEWQRYLVVSHYNLAALAVEEGKAGVSREHFQKSHDILVALLEAGNQVSTGDRQILKVLKHKLGIN